MDRAPWDGRTVLLMRFSMPRPRGQRPAPGALWQTLPCPMCGNAVQAFCWPASFMSEHEVCHRKECPAGKGPETANPALGGILSRRLHAFDGAGRCYLALGHLTFIRSGVRSEDPCNHPVIHA